MAIIGRENQPIYPVGSEKPCVAKKNKLNNTKKDLTHQMTSGRLTSMIGKSKTTNSGKQQGRHVLLKEYVRSNYKVGDLLPSDKKLSAKLGISRYATLKALNELSGEGHVRRVQGFGTVITEPKNLWEENGFKQIGFLADEFESGSMVEIMRGVEEYYRSKSTRLALLNNNFDHELEVSYIQDLKVSPCTGAIVICGGSDASLEELQHLIDAGYPLVTVDRHFPSIKCPFVESDHEKLAYNAVKYLLELGHRKIAYITHGSVAKNRISSIREREEGYLRALVEANIEVRPEYIQNFDDINIDERISPSTVFTSGYVAMHKLLSLPDPPTAVFFLMEDYVQGAYRAVTNHGLKVPDDISIICVGSRTMIDHLPISITRMVQSWREIGGVAAELLERLVENKEIPQRHIKLGAELLVGDSTAAPKK